MPECSRCHRTIPAEEVIILPNPMKDQPNLVLCANCAAILSRRSNPRGNPWIKTIIVGIIAISGFVILWMALLSVTGNPFDFMAIVIGWLMAVLLCKTNEKLPRQSIQWAAVFFTLAVILAREYILGSFLAGFDASSPSRETIFRSLQIVIPEIINRLVANPATILMWMLAIWISYLTPIRYLPIRSK
jgi:hypothetical protein